MRAEEYDHDLGTVQVKSKGKKQYTKLYTLQGFGSEEMHQIAGTTRNWVFFPAFSTFLCFSKEEREHELLLKSSEMQRWSCRSIMGRFKSPSWGGWPGR